MPTESSNVVSFLGSCELQTVSASSQTVSTATHVVDRPERRLRKALRAAQQDGDLVEQAACCLRLGDMLLARGQSETAGVLYRKALKLSQAVHAQRQAAARQESPTRTTQVLSSDRAEP